MNATASSWRKLSVACLVMALSLPAAPSLADSSAGTGDKGTDMLLDLVLLRPVGLAATGVGAVVFVVSLPFTLASGGASSAACDLVGEPLAYTFTRPLGQLDGQSRSCGQDASGQKPAP